MLSLGGSSLVILPEVGGSIAGWRIDGTDLLRPASPDFLVGRAVSAAACFPLLPYGNRIAEGRFRWMGREHGLTRNFGDHPHAIHGVGWHRSWDVDTVSSDAAVMSLRHRPARPGDWPFPFDATLRYAVAGPRLTIALALTNRHDGAAPAGLGVHPYFPRVPGTRIRFAAGGVWMNDPTCLPIRHEALPTRWDHRAGLAVGSQPLDNAFTGWSDAVDITWPGGAITMTADPIFGNLQVYTPQRAAFFCVEPMTHVPDAINRDPTRAGQAMHSLEPDETLRGSIHLRARLGE